MSKKHKKSKIRELQSKEVISINKRKCIACTACAINCSKLTDISVLRLSTPDRKSITTKKETFDSSGCISCGQCTLICPTSAINSEDPINKVLAAKDSNKFMVAIFAPSLKATLGEEFNLPIGTDVSKKLPSSARKLGFDKVFETDFGADLTVIEESRELFNKINNKETLPMFSSCCPSWIKWMEKFKPELKPYISTCKSPQQMLGAMIKTYFAEKNKIDPKNIFVLSIKPCTSKKVEIEREGMGRDGYNDIDAVMTVREYSNFLKAKAIDLNNLPEEKADSLLGEYSGAGTIFGSTGGVLKASLRTLAYYFKDTTLNLMEDIKLNDLEGYPYVKVIDYKINGLLVKTAAVSGINNLIKFLNSGLWKNYHFIEVMACLGGCINGGGTPKVSKKSNINGKLCISCGSCIENCPVDAISFNAEKVAIVSTSSCIGCTLCSNLCRSNAINMDYYDKSNNSKLTKNYLDLRSSVLNSIDTNSTIRFSHENKELKELYLSYLGEVAGKKAEELLHYKYK